jgi:hypothetical protein
VSSPGIVRVDPVVHDTADPVFSTAAHVGLGIVVVCRT